MFSDAGSSTNRARTSFHNFSRSPVSTTGAGPSPPTPGKGMGTGASVCFALALGLRAMLAGLTGRSNAVPI